MRRGGRSYNFQAPWRWRDDPIQSSISKTKGFRWLVALAAFSVALSIIMWHLRHHISTHDLHSKKPGFVFPLYSYYYKQFLNASDDLEGEMWHGSRAAHSRGLRQMEVSGPFFKIRQGLYVTMKLGVPPEQFNFHVDTGSMTTWVYCKVPHRQSKIPTLGPNGIFQPMRGSTMRCIGTSSNLCQELQFHQNIPCNSIHGYECLLHIGYGDTSIYMGVFITESLTLPMHDKSEVNVYSVFGCVIQKKKVDTYVPTFIADGILGLGNCKETIADQWFQKKLISQNVVGFCIAKELDPKQVGAQIGYISIGNDFKEKFEERNPVWAILIEAPSGAYCAYTTNIAFISLETNIFMPRSGGSPILIDLGSDKTFLESYLYNPLLETLDFYATERGYIEVEDDPLLILSEQRRCWKPPSKTRKSDKGKAISPINDFPNVKFAIEGVPEAADDDLILYLTIQPSNYLEWDANEKRLCVNILKDDDVQNLGALMLRDHLFVLDSDNQRFRWQPDSCEL